MNFQLFSDFVKENLNFNTNVSLKSIKEIVEVALLAPNSFNLQPTEVVVIDSQDVKEKLLRACLYQKKIVRAAALVVFTGDRDVVAHNLEEVFEMESMSEESEKRVRLQIQWMFDQGMLGLTWLAKAIFSAIIRLFTPLPYLPAVHKRLWVTKQVMMSAAYFTLAAKASGYVVEEVEGFDEWRVKYHLGIPLRRIVPCIYAVYKSPTEAISSSHTALPAELLIHQNHW